MSLISADGRRSVRARPASRSNKISARSVGRWRKRGLDLVGSLLLLGVFAIPMLLVGLLVRLTTPGPAIFRQVRLGKDERPFTLYKFRTMQQDSPEDIHRAFVEQQLASPDGGSEQGGLFKLSSDPRVTPLGRFLRRTSLDELPQLFNVVRGQMALVGPRPSLPWEAELFPSDCRGRFAVPPGITGLWQTSGRSRLTMAQALRLDVEYVTEWTLRGDLLILLRTIPAVLRCSDAR